MGANESSPLPVATHGSTHPPSIPSSARYSPDIRPPSTPQMKVLIMGSRCVGKTTLFARLKGMRPPSLVHGEHMKSAPQHDAGEIQSTRWGLGADWSILQSDTAQKILSKDTVHQDLLLLVQLFSITKPPYTHTHIPTCLSLQHFMEEWWWGWR